jgi:hypothetical protein
VKTVVVIYISSLILLLSIIYITYVLAKKEKGYLQIVGFVMAAILTLMALCMLWFWVFRGDYAMVGGIKNVIKGGRELKCTMLNEIVRKDPSIAKDMCKDPKVRMIMKDASKRVK